MDTETEALQQKLDSAVKHYNSLLAGKDKSHALELARVESQFRNSSQWRIGCFVVETYNRLLHLFRRPVQETLPDHPQVAVSPEAASQPEPVVSGTENRIPVIAAILDDAALACIKPECSLLTFRPDNWKEVFEGIAPDLLLVEPAWHGNQGSWQYKITKGPYDVGTELRDLAGRAKELHVPTVFWSKRKSGTPGPEDETERLFDHVLPAPQAAQPALHHPAGGNHRSHNVGFYGSYSATANDNLFRSPEVVLNPSREAGLHIYEEYFGSAGRASGSTSFPEKYRACLQPRISYTGMASVYRNYKVFIDTGEAGSGRDLFPGKVFEQLACGTPVISNYSRGREEFPGDVVHLTETEAKTRDHLQLLLHDRLAWMKSSVRGIRMVMESHTYHDKLHMMFSQAGISTTPFMRPQISLIVKLHEGVNQLERLAAEIADQTCRPASVILLGESKIAQDELERFGAMAGAVPIFSMNIFEDQLTAMIRNSGTVDYYAVWMAGDWHGPNYLKDYMLATRYSKSALFGKMDHYVFNGARLTEEHDGSAFAFTHRVPVGTLMFKSERLSSVNLGFIYRPDVFFEAFVPEIQGLDPLNYVKCGKHGGDGLREIAQTVFI